MNLALTATPSLALLLSLTVFAGNAQLAGAAPEVVLRQSDLITTWRGPRLPVVLVATAY